LRQLLMRRASGERTHVIIERAVKMDNPTQPSSTHHGLIT